MADGNGAGRSNPDHRLLSTLWSHHLVNRPENQLTVRAAQPGSTSKILLQLCTNTYNAYIGLSPARI